MLFQSESVWFPVSSDVNGSENQTKRIFKLCGLVQKVDCLCVIARGTTAEDATQNVIDVQIPALRELCESGSLTIDNIDVFCEKGVFDTDCSRRILKAGKEAGWKLNFHGDELHMMNSGEVSGVMCEVSVV